MYQYNYTYNSQSPFYRNENITSVVVEDGITSIGSYAFYSCTALTSVTLPDSIKSINDCAFFDCTKLENITLPDNITSIDGSAFYRTAYYNNGSNRKGCINTRLQ